MAITTVDGYVAATKQMIDWWRSGTRTSPSVPAPMSVFDLAGQPGAAAALAAGNTANGLVHTSSTTGYYPINSFAGGTTGYLTRVQYGWSGAGRIQLYDRLFVCGAYTVAGGTTTLASQPSYASRVPSSDYRGLELWAECTTATTGSPNITVTYTNQDGTTGRTGGSLSLSSHIVGQMKRIPLQGGDTGVQAIESVNMSGGSAGAFNVNVLRPLWASRNYVANGGDVHDLIRTGMPVVFATSALFVTVTPDGSTTGTPELQLEIASG